MRDETVGMHSGVAGTCHFCRNIVRLLMYKNLFWFDIGTSLIQSMSVNNLFIQKAEHPVVSSLNSSKH